MLKIKNVILTICVLFSLTLLATISVSIYYKYKSPLSAEPSKQVQLSPSKKWAIAAGGLIVRMNNDTFEQLKNRFSSSETKKILSRWWDITDRKTALSTIAWLKTEGHNSRFKELYFKITDMNNIEYSQFWNRRLSESGAEDALRADFVRKNGKALEKTGLIAWDQARLINVARFSFTAGYISEEEAWLEIMDAAKLIQNTYHSWKEFGDHYIFGRSFWDPDRTQRDLKPFFDWLNEDPTSPWRTLPWDTPLSY